MKTLLISIITTSMLVSTVVSGELRGCKTTTAIRTAEQAVDRALEITGFDRANYKKRSDPSEMAAKVTVLEDKTPFFHDRIVDRELWRVTFDSVYVEIPRLAPSWERNQIRKTYDVYFDPETGYLLKIESRWDGRDTTLSEEPPADFATNDMLKDGIAYVDIVKVIPEIDLYKALQIATDCYAANAKQIIAHLVLTGQGGVDPRPVWSILGRGTPPFDISGKGYRFVPVWQKNRMRCLVDAMNGDYLIFISNTPAVEPPIGWPLDSVGTGE